MAQTPTLTSVEQNATVLKIHGTGFNPSTELNTIFIGETGSCNVTLANTTLIICTIINSPSGWQIVQVNVDEKGFALSNTSFTVNVPLHIISFEPSEGGAGGGYILTINGIGFSLNTSVTIGGNLCADSQVINFSSILCIVPPSIAVNTSQVIVSVIDEMNSVNASSLFIYNTTDTPRISSINPTVVSMAGGLLNITGTDFGNSSVVVFVGTNSVNVLSSSINYIQVNLPQLPPGLYPVTVNTSTGSARSAVYIEYRFYIQQISPQVGSLYGGNDVYIQGEGFDNLTTINFRDQMNGLFPCEIIAIVSSQIHCRTTSFVKQVTITTNGTHPTYRIGVTWSPQRVTVQRGTVVNWQWESQLSTWPLTYNIQQVANAYITQSLTDGFDSGPAVASGKLNLIK
jgi:hypothetical protein